MHIEIAEEDSKSLSAYASISSAFSITEVLATVQPRPSAVSWRYERDRSPRPTCTPYVKDHDAYLGSGPHTDTLTLQTLRTLCTVLVALALTACRPTLTPAPARLTRADSLVLERSPCFGACPVYRLSLHADGNVTFTPLAPSDSTRSASDSIPPTQFEGLLHEAERIGFFGLPPIILHDHTLCPVVATDRPTATVTVFRADSVNRVVDYQGCRAGNDTSVVARLEALRHFESAIDSVAGSERWIRPTRRR